MGGVGKVVVAIAGAICMVGGVGGCGDPDSGSPLPVMSSRGGPHMAHPQLVPIFFPEDTSADFLTQFSQWVVTSSWLTAVGADYGVDHGAVLGVVHRLERAPDAITDGQIVDLVYAGLGDGTLPRPPSGDLGEVLYMVFFPAHTAITAGSSMSCTDFGGYHDSVRRGGVELAYAVIADCPDFGRGIDEVQGRELVASHELIEAATDPFPVNHPGFQLRDPVTPWRAIGDEVGDLCERGDTTMVWHDGNFVAQRSWSSAAAAAGTDPCVPGATKPYFNMVPALKTVPRIPPGGHQVIELSSLVSDAASGFAWAIEADPSGRDLSSVMLHLGSEVVNGPTTTTLDVTVAPTAAQGSEVDFFVVSYTQSTYQELPMFAIAGDPCSSFAGCEACTAHYGCGFCPSSGKCEPVGASSCSADSLETWAGSCPGACAAHGGSCTDCASQPGCGWCAAGNQCLEASHDYWHPAKARCDYADWSFTPRYCP